MSYEDNQIVIHDKMYKVMNKLSLGGYYLDREYNHRMEHQYLIVGVRRAIMVYDLTKGSE